MMCFAPDCKHYSEKDSCKFFTFPKELNQLRRWIKLIRRADRQPSDGSRICSCHFKDGLKENGPTMFEHNANRRLSFNSPPRTKRTKKAIVCEYTQPDSSEFDAETNGVTATTSTTATSSVVENKGCTMNSSVLIEAENMFLKQELDIVTKKLEKMETSFSFNQIKNQDELVVLYTGLPNKDIFLSLFQLLENIERNYYLGWNVECIPAIDQLFLTLYKLRQNPPHKDIAQRFNCSVATVTNIFLTWLNLLHEVIFSTLMSSVPSVKDNQTCLPNCFALFPNTRMVLDCTEIFSEIPCSLQKQKETYSHYKHRNTLKGLVGVAPNGVVSYVSSLYPGSTSDKKIVQHCGVLNIFEPGDLIIADKGFLINDILPAGVSLNIPPFLCQPQFTPSQVIQTKNIARARIHVERAIRRIKAYKILNLIPQTLMSSATKIFQVCGALTNFQYPLLKEVETYFVNDQ